MSQETFLASFPQSKWVKCHKILKKSKVRRYTPDVSLLYILAAANMSALIRAHSERQSCFKVEGERYGPPILAASAAKSTEAMRAMLELETQRLSATSRLALDYLMPPSADNKGHVSSGNFKFSQTVDLFPQLILHRNDEMSVIFLIAEQPDIHKRHSREETTLALAMKKAFSY
ncbi:hypothetical protein F5Y09DRAFT_251565 [Xylaria sp. FL1042]|nr:hypothetical protein F5Y09DRAFT_251565 [Xylaria sp. FL1042]